MADAPNILIVEARYYEEISEQLLRGAVALALVLSARGENETCSSSPRGDEVPASVGSGRPLE